MTKSRSARQRRREKENQQAEAAKKAARAGAAAAGDGGGDATEGAAAGAGAAGAAADGRQVKRRRGEGESGGVPSNGNWTEVVKKNELFDRFYQVQNLVGADEWQAFQDTLATPLPSTFRITGTRREATQLLQLLKDRYFVPSTGAEGNLPPPAVPIAWYPDELGWRMNASRFEMRRGKSLIDFRKFLVMQTELGYISRQEAVSMVPPLLLDVHPGHKVLDMCAAPGSKTAQLIEMIQSDGTDGTIPQGLIIANDTDIKRCFILIHQTQRLQTPVVLVTNHDASQFPTITLEGTDPTTGKARTLQFDRILADVPCSGDGTLRKNPMIWRKWSPSFGLGLHRLQMRLLERAMQMVTVGGRIVYSTCTFNPVENEAIVAAILQKYPGVLELVDVSDSLPQLRRRPGLTTWQVMSRTGEMYAQYADVPTDGTSNLSRTMFPPADGVALGLPRCLRIIPQDQDTGGFFVAVLRKVADAVAATPAAVKVATPKAEVAEAAASAPVAVPTVAPMEEDGAGDDVPMETMDGEPVALEGRPAGGAKAKGARKTQPGSVTGDPIKDAPYLFLPESSPVFEMLKTGYGIPDTFPRHLLLTRTENDRKNHVFLVSPAVCEVLHSPELARLRILQTGLRVFARNDGHGMNDSGFRILQEALPYLDPFLGGQRVHIEPVDLHILLQCENHPVDKLSAGLKAALASVRLSVNGTAYGSFFFVFDPAKYPDVKCYLNGAMLLCAWRGHKTAQVLVNKKERVRILSLFDRVLADAPPAQAPRGPAPKPAAAATAATAASAAAASAAAAAPAAGAAGPAGTEATTAAAAVSMEEDVAEDGDDGEDGGSGDSEHSDEDAASDGES